MKIKLVLLAMTAISCASTSFAKPAEQTAPTDDQVLKKVSFEQLQSATNYMLFLIEAGSDSKAKKIKCAPSAETAQSWVSGPLHALSDEKMKSEADLYKQKPAAFKSRIANCLKTCSCNAFQQLLDSEDDETKKLATFTADHAFLEKEAKSETTEKSHACAAQYKGFCGGLLEKYLKAN